MHIIREYRRKLQMSQKELAQMLNVRQSTVSMWETGSALPRADKLLHISKLFGCTIDELMENWREERHATA